jgi:hypothetical protein
MPVKNGIQINRGPVVSDVKPPSLKIFNLQGKQLLFRSSIPAGVSRWTQPAGTTPAGICLVLITWPDGKTIARRVVVAR